MKNASGVPVGTIKYTPIGMGAGGYVDGLDIADDGWMCTRNDTTVGHIRGPDDLVWRQVFIAGGNLPNADILFKNPAQRTFEICFAPSNSMIMYAASGGFMKKSTDRGATWTKLTGYKAGAVDTTLSSFANENARHGGARLRVSPTNPLNVGLIHPTEGLYYSTNGGTTWTLSASVLAPTSSAAGVIHFASDTEVWIVTNGNPVRRSTTGVGGTFTAITGGPSVAASISSGGGNVYIVGNSNLDADTQMFMYSAGAFTQPSGIMGGAVMVRPSLTSTVSVIRIGGMFHHSTNSGVAWSTADFVLSKKADDVPYLGRSLSDFLALGQARYHPTLNRIIIANGIGVFNLDTIPPVSGTKVTSISKGIEMMLPMDVVISPNGMTMIPAQDKAAFVFTRANIKQGAEKQAPNNNLTLRMGCTGGIDYARDNENYIAMAYVFGAVADISTDAGKTFTTMPTIPTFTHNTEGVFTFTGGGIAVSNAGNMVWVSTSSTGPATNNAVKYTTDGGTTWANPIFAGVSMLGAHWNHSYPFRRRILQAYKGAAGVFYIFCNGTGIGDALDIAQTGLWKSTDGGANFVKTKAGHFVSYPADFWQAKLRLNNNQSGHFFWVQGATNNYPVTPYAGGLYFSNNDGANTYSTGTALAGWSEPDDIALGAKLATSQVYETLYCIGWRGGAYGVYMCIDFDPATRNGTWTLTKEWIMGKPDNDCVLGADPTVPGRIVVAVASGGAEVGEYVDTAAGT